MPVIQEQLILDHITAGPFQTNLYVVGCAETRAGVIIDGGFNAAGLLALARRHNLNIEHILQTHAHIDHVMALPELRAQLPDVPISLHPADRSLYDAVPMQAAMFGLQAKTLPPVDRALAEGELVCFGELEAEVLLMPGHSPGSVIFYFEAQHTMVSGDVLFAGSIGRVDLPGSDVRAMQRSLDRLKEFPPETRVFSGHGPPTTIGQELRMNPFLRGRIA